MQQIILETDPEYLVHVVSNNNGIQLRSSSSTCRLDLVIEMMPSSDEEEAAGAASLDSRASDVLITPVVVRESRKAVHLNQRPSVNAMELEPRVVADPLPLLDSGTRPYVMRVSAHNHNSCLSTSQVEKTLVDAGVQTDRGHFTSITKRHFNGDLCQLHWYNRPQGPNQPPSPADTPRVKPSSAPSAVSRPRGVEIQKVSNREEYNKKLVKKPKIVIAKELVKVDKHEEPVETEKERRCTVEEQLLVDETKERRRSHLPHEQELLLARDEYSHKVVEEPEVIITKEDQGVEDRTRSSGVESLLLLPSSKRNVREINIITEQTSSEDTLTREGVSVGPQISPRRISAVSKQATRVGRRSTLDSTYTAVSNGRRLSSCAGLPQQRSPDYVVFINKANPRHTGNGFAIQRNPVNSVKNKNGFWGKLFHR